MDFFGANISSNFDENEKCYTAARPKKDTYMDVYQQHL
jgi:hypothetical protein